MDRLISEQYLIEHLKACFENGRPMYRPTLDEVLEMIKAIPSAEPYKEMTNGEVLKTIFPDVECDFKKFCEEDTVVFNLNGFYMRVSADWCNSLYSERRDKE